MGREHFVTEPPRKGLTYPDALAGQVHLRLRTHTHDEIANDRQSCVGCGRLFTFRGLDFFWDGMPLCDECPPADWKEIQQDGYAYAQSKAIRLGFYFCHDCSLADESSCPHTDLSEEDHIIELWESAIADYVDELNITGTRLGIA
jgi:hypothetical protein